MPSSFPRTCNGPALKHNNPSNSGNLHIVLCLHDDDVYSRAKSSGGPCASPIQYVSFPYTDSAKINKLSRPSFQEQIAAVLYLRARSKGQSGRWRNICYAFNENHSVILHKAIGPEYINERSHHRFREAGLRTDNFLARN